MVSVFKPDKISRNYSPFMDLITGNKIIGGIHRFCLRITGLAKKNILSKFKFGVSKCGPKGVSMKCFSDFNSGYSFFSIGQTRNGSNNSGLPYKPGFNDIGRLFNKFILLGFVYISCNSIVKVS